MEKLKHFDKFIRAEDILGAGCLDNCKCKDLNLNEDEDE